mmetsp:Transcript_111682/g.216292  ORF Transcript_111682/g.216292 Transcript_111682/m.216292 type:complete len:139 (-) Transcript_111682:1560-1976(-)
MLWLEPTPAPLPLLALPPKTLKEASPRLGPALEGFRDCDSAAVGPPPPSPRVLVPENAALQPSPNIEEPKPVPRLVPIVDEPLCRPFPAVSARRKSSASPTPGAIPRGSDCPKVDAGSDGIAFKSRSVSWRLRYSMTS